MADYKEIKGQTVQNLSADPTLGSGTEGQVWFNSTSGKLKSLVSISGWSSSSNMLFNTSYGQCSSVMTQTAMLCMGRYTPGPTTTFNTVQLYNGSGWSTQTAMNSARYTGQGGGTATAAIIAGGVVPGPTTNTEEYNGTTWTEVNNIPTVHIYGTSAGTQTAMYAGGGNAGVPVQEYDGTSWTNGGSLNTPRTGMNWGVGTLTAGLTAGGEPYTPKVAEEYDGTSWANGGTASTQHGYAQGAGIQTDGLMIGGHEPTPTRLTAVEAYDGSAWSTGSALSTGRSALQGGGTSSAAVVGGGDTPSATNVTEEYNVSFNVRTAGAWSAITGMNTGRQGFNGMGISTAALVAGGET